MLLEVSFDAALARLVGLIRSGDLLTASQDAYGDKVAGLARVGPLGPVPGVSRLVEARFSEPVTHGDSGTVALRWEAIGPSGRLFPALDADLTLTPAGEGATTLRLDGAYRSPLGALGTGLDRVILHRVATATIRGFLNRVGAAITRPAPMTGPTSRNGHQDEASLPPDAGVS